MSDTPQRHGKKRSRKTVQNVADSDDGVSPPRVKIYHDLFETKPPEVEVEHTEEEEEEPTEEEVKVAHQCHSENQEDSTTDNKRVKLEEPTVTTSSSSSSTPDDAAKRRTQLLCNAWAKQPSGLTFTQLLQLDMEDSKVPRISHKQLPAKILVTLNADVFETTKFKLTRDGKYQQILSESEAQSLAEAKSLPLTTTKELPKKETTTTPQDQKQDGREQGTFEWIEGSIKVAMLEDAEYLNKLHQWVRQNVEYFSAQRGDRKGITRGRVGVRCMYCRDIHSSECESFPGTFNGIHKCITNKFVSHFQQCPFLPSEKRNWFLAALQDAESFKMPPKAKHFEGGITNAVYSRVAARRIGLTEILHDGLRFTRDLTLEPLPMETVKIREQNQLVATEATKPRAHAKVGTKAESFLAKAVSEKDTENSLSRASDKARCSDYLFLSIRQAILCHATVQEAIVRSKRNMGVKRAAISAGYTGFCCRWCKKMRVFPSAGDGIMAAILGNLANHFINSCEAIPENLRSAFYSYKSFHAKQHGSIQKSLRDELVSDLWFRLRSNDRHDDNSAVQPPSNVTGKGNAKEDDNDKKLTTCL